MAKESQNQRLKKKTSIYFFGLGRRKTAIARVRLFAGSGQAVINDREITQPNPVYLEPLRLTGLQGKFNISVKVNGGGTVSSLWAIRLGIARALIKFDPNLRSTLKTAGMLTRDPRSKERKKPGLKRARRAPQWAKR